MEPLDVDFGDDFLRQTLEFADEPVACSGDGDDDGDGGDSKYDECTAETRARFSKVETVSDFVALWREFYTGHIAIPNYHGSFLPTIKDHDNQLVTEHEARKFYFITSRGLIAFNSQVGSRADGQKSCLSAFCSDFERVKNLCASLNRYNGIVAYAVLVDFEPQQDSRLVAPIYVTYDNTSAADAAADSVVMPASTSTRLNGTPFTKQNVGEFTDGQALAETFKWLRPDLRNAFLNDTQWWAVTAIDANYDRPNLLLNAIVDSVKDWPPLAA